MIYGFVPGKNTDREKEKLSLLPILFWLWVVTVCTCCAGKTKINKSLENNLCLTRRKTDHRGRLLPLLGLVLARGNKTGKTKGPSFLRASNIAVDETPRG